MQTDKTKMIYGYCLLVLLAILAGIIALGKVEQQTSYGLQDVLGGLLVLAGSFANWAFNNKDTNVGSIKENNANNNKETQTKND